MTNPVALPTKLAQWATTLIVDPVTNAPNVVEPTESKKETGWNAFEPPARNYFNWLAKTSYDWDLYVQYRLCTLEITTDGDGAQIFAIPNTLCTLYAVDMTQPTHYLFAMGWRGASGAVTLNVISSNVLTLGAAGTDGSQAISGGTAANIRCFGKYIQTTTA